MSTGADLEGTSLRYLDRITAAGNDATARQNAVLGASAERLVDELRGVYGKYQTKGTGASEMQQLNARLGSMGDLLTPAQQRSLTEQMKTDLRQAQATGNNSAQDLAKILANTSKTITDNAKPNTVAIDNAGTRLATFWAKENSLFRDRVTAMTQAAAAEGKSYRKLAAEVRELLLLERRAGTESARSTRVNAKLGISARAELIARTELQTAYVQGQAAHYRQNGYEWVRWIAAAERSCPFCISRDGLVYELGEIEAAIPAHPRCRCSLAPTDPPDNWKRKGTDKGVEAAESLDDAYWARSRSAKLREFRQTNPKFSDAEVARYVRTPTNAQAYLRPGVPAPEPVWAPSGSLSPNLEQVVLNAAAAAKNISGRAERAALAKEAQATAKANEQQQQSAEAIEDRVGRMRVQDIDADPTRFQYKLNANSTTGEVGSLKGVGKWNEDLAGVLSVWKDPANGKVYVINGHNRLALAKRLNPDGDLPVLYIKARDAAQARAIGAKQNIANGDGTAIDAAKFMRDSKLSAADLQKVGLNLKGAVARDGAALAKLPDHIFRAVVEGRIPIDKAAAIGRSGLSAAQMNDAYKILQARPTMKAATLEEVLSQARASSTRSVEERNLFGTTKVETSTMVQRAELAAKFKADSGRTIRTLDKAAGKADVLAAKGNKIDVRQAQVKAADARARLDVFELQKNRPSSPVAKALNEGAALVQDATGRGGKAAATKKANELVNDAVDREVARMANSSKGLLRSVADAQARAAGRNSKPPELELAQAPADVGSKTIPARLLNPETAKPGAIGSLKPSQILTDAKRFQYKAATDARTGEVGSLEGISRYDSNLGGVLTVWRDPANGQTYVINGHNRLAAAKRLGADAVNVRYIKAADAAEARALGALANIAEGQGTAIDAAKFMRDRGMTAADMTKAGVPMRKAVATDGAALANLPDDLWRQVVNEQISVEKGAIIGRSGLDAEGMAKVAKVLKAKPNTSAGTVQELVQRERALMDQGQTGNLFGDLESATFQLDRAQMSRSVRDGLLGDKSLFGTLSTSRAARTLEGAGSQVDTSANAAAATEAERYLAAFDQLKNVSGPVSQALNSGANRLAAARNATDRLAIQKQTQADVVEALKLELGDLAPPQAPPPEAPGQVGLFG